MSTTNLPWERQAGEPDEWYARFCVYCELGAARSLARACRMVAHIEQKEAKRPNASWYRMAQQWQWRQRAAAWDEAERERLRPIEQGRRFDAREHRLKMIDELLVGVYSVLLSADLPAMESVEARMRLPTLRIFFRDLLAAHRAEMGPPDFGEDAEGGVAPFSADDFLAAQRAIAEWQQSRRFAPYRAEFYRLRNLLATLFPEPEQAKRIALAVGAAADVIHDDWGAVENWHAVLAAVERLRPPDLHEQTGKHNPAGLHEQIGKHNPAGLHEQTGKHKNVEKLVAALREQLTLPDELQEALRDYQAMTR